ncbi:SDR family oxidoreductase [Aurantibacillus circumpalustris]|uniref:SDR family oxidoreductase n=1 Tax=Aurantibacillus circumpalustris TaxID=3036359 RepID=UPI00295BDBE1|nr:SDR family oxidoreductase [Aurantibacillus circumpalustris]
MSDKKTKRVVLITGGTKGIGKEIAFKFAEHGDQCIITYGWGSIEDSDFLNEFKAKNLPEPFLIQSDVINNEDTANLMNEIKTRFGTVDIFISNVSFANLVKGIDDYSEAALLKSIEYSCWPMIEYTRQMKTILGKYPKYVMGLSSHGPDRFYVNYDFAAATKTLNEVLVKYLNYHFYDEAVIFNILRTRPVITDSLLMTVGKEWKEFIEKYDIPGTHVDLEEVANVAYIMCSGLMDGIRGQTINADKGYNFIEGYSYMYKNREEFGI